MTENQTSAEKSELERLSERLSEVEKSLAQIQERNCRVEADKAWETSPTRTVLICALLYIVAAGVFHLLNSQRIWLDALLPPTGFYLSTQTLPLLKQWWIARRK